MRHDPMMPGRSMGALHGRLGIGVGGWAEKKEATMDARQ